MVYKRTRAGSRFVRDKSPLAKRRAGIPLKSTVYEDQLGSASIRWELHRTRYEGWCIHCKRTIPRNSLVEWNKGIGIRHEKCAKQFEESEKYTKKYGIKLITPKLGQLVSTESQNVFEKWWKVLIDKKTI